MTTPISHIIDAQGLLGDARIQFFQFDLYGGGSFFFTADHTRSWNGDQWIGIGIKLGGEGSYGDEQVARPKLAIQNPDGIFSLPISEGSLDGAIVTRYTVLLDDVERNNPVYVRQIWQVGRIVQLNRIAVNMELRGLADAPNAVIPAQTYAPPKYPLVSF